MAATTVRTRVCTKCDQEKALTKFARHSQMRNGRDTRCLACKRKASAGYYKRWTPDQRIKHRERTLRQRYGITVAMLEQMYELQEGCCKICGAAGHCPARSHKGRNTTTLHIDHNHETGEVRGLLCFHCNAGIGHFKERVALLARTVAYLAGDDLSRP